MRRKRSLRKIAILMATLILAEALLPGMAMALTSGPNQPEFSGFGTLGVDEVVNHYSGDLNYTLPLMEVPGNGGSYPLSLTYNSEVRMETEASMVGYGWNLNVGQITRNVSGIPDDFNGEDINKYTSMRPNWSIGVTPLRAKFKIINKDLNLGTDLTLKYNNYKGFGVEVGAGISFRPMENSKLSGSFRTSVSSLEGSSWSAGLSMDALAERLNTPKEVGLSLSGNSLSGIKNVGLNTGIGMMKLYESTYPVNLGQAEYIGVNTFFSIATGLENFLTYLAPEYSGYYTQQFLKNNGKWVPNSSYGFNYLEGLEGDDEAIGDYHQLTSFPIQENATALNSCSASKDQYSINTQAISGTFEAYRGDVGVFSSPNVTSYSAGINLGIQTGVAATAELGLKLGLPISRTVSQYRNGTNQQAISYGFQGETSFNEYEPFYFKFKNELTGELASGTEIFSQAYDYIGNDHPVRMRRGLNQRATIPPAGTGIDFALLSGTLEGRNNNQIISTNNWRRTSRKPRTKSIEYYTNSQINQNAVAFRRKAVQSFIDVSEEGRTDFSNHDDAFIASRTVPTNRDFGDDKISAMSVRDESGAYWNFDLPVLNHVKRDVTFSLKKDDSRPCAKDIIPYNDFKCNELEGLEGTIDHEPGVPESEELLSITETPSYATSYLLTSVLGDNYVDIDNNGPEDGDIGHWMRFDYLRKNDGTNPYNWRIPYCGVSYNPGSWVLEEDDKGSFTYGERDQYYVERIETPTHVALFDYEVRDDNRGVQCWLNSDRSDDDSPSSLRLSEIRLFAKSIENEQTQLNLVKTVVLHHSYTIHQGVLNNKNASGGKLTLDKVEFLNYESTRGALNPYIFTYYNEDCCSPTPPPPPPGDDEDNPDGDGGVGGPGGEELLYASQGEYSPHLDRWGMKHVCSEGSDECNQLRAPYTRQGGGEGDPDFEARINCSARQGHLEQIVLPSGAKLNFGVGRDHYSHVQNKRAGQMMKITGFGPSKGNAIPNSSYTNQSNQDNGRVYFQLAEPISTTDPLRNVMLQNMISDLYEDERGKQLFFKTFTELVPQHGGSEYIDGYVYIAKDQNLEYEIHFDQTSIQGGNFTEAYVIVESQDIPVANNFTRHPSGKYHPFLICGWQILKNSYNKILLGASYEAADGNEEIRSLGRQVLSSIRDIIQMVSGFYNNAKTENYCRNVDLDYSWLRLCSPDNIKYGDGVRITRVMMSDIWNEEETPNLGFIYRYTENVEHFIQDEGSGTRVVEQRSTGVASNEPQIGSEENVYKYAFDYSNNLKNSTSRTLFQESPINANLLPSASVGYSKVTVMSIASSFHHFIGGNSGKPIPPDFPHGFTQFMPELSSSGKTEYEFYTCKDYPVLFDRTTLSHSVYSPNYFPIFFGSINIRGFTGTQGYVVETNNMSGKMKSKKSFEQLKDGSFRGEPISSQEYFYHDDKRIIQDGVNNHEVKSIVNNVDVLVNEVEEDPQLGFQADIRQAEVGVTREMINEVVDYHNFNGSLGIDAAVDFDITKFPFVVITPTGWPSVQVSSESVETSVTNKHIHRSGILEKVVVKDDQSVVSTENLVFDPYNGSPLLTSTTNQFDAPQYDYTIPAYQHKKNFLPSYINWGTRFTGTIMDGNWDDCTGSALVTNIPATIAEDLIQGDIVSYEGKLGGTHLAGIGVVFHDFTEEVQDDKLINLIGITEADLAGEYAQFRFEVIKPNRDNLSTHPAQNIKALNNPTLNYSEQAFANCANGSTDLYTVDDILHSEIFNYSEFHHTYRNNDGAIFYRIPSLISSAQNIGLIYTRGFLGNYQLRENYTFHGNRENQIISEKGIVNNVPIVNNEIPSLHCSGILESWISKSEKDYAPYFEGIRQSVGEDGVYQSVLRNYALGTTQVQVDEANHANHYKETAKIIGGRYWESAFSSFEDYEINYLYEDDGQTLGFSNKQNKGHFDFNYAFNTSLNDVYQIYPLVEIDGNQITTGKSYPNFDQQFKEALLYFSDDNTSEIFRFRPAGGFSLLEEHYNGPGKYNGQDLTRFTFTDNSGNFCDRIENESQVYVALFPLDDSPTLQAQNNATDLRAHTGQSSWLLNQDTEMPQSTLDFEHGEEYVFSVWVNTRDEVGSDISNCGIQVIIDGDITGGPIELNPQGNRIDGWQRIEGVFRADANGGNIITPVVNFELGTCQELFIDDVRIYPLGAKMTSYVYDQRYQRVSHILDENNYFTEFVYDGEGNLIAINKETERGIRTIEEQRKFIAPQN